MGFFIPQVGRSLAEFFSKMTEKWDALTPEEKASERARAEAAMKRFCP